MLQAPKIDTRSGEAIYHQLVRDLRERLNIDADGQDPLARALLRVFARYCELIIERLNKAPDRNHAAFLDFLNVSRVPPVAAQAPLTFTPVKQLPGNSGPIVVPRGTKVAAAPGEGETEPIVFETMREVSLTTLELRKILALHPVADLYTDKSALAVPEQASPGEFAFACDRPIPHECYVGHDQIFGRAAIAELCLRWEMEPSSAPDSRLGGIEWWIPAHQGNIMLTPVRDTTLGLQQSGEIVFRNLPEWPTHEVFGQPSRWLACRLANTLRAKVTDGTEMPPSAPLVGKVTLSAFWEMKEGPADSAFFNNMPLDLSKDFFPLGERPRFGDVFYLSCGFFAKPQAEVTLKIKLTNPASGGNDCPIPTVNKSGNARLQWEYWDGRCWQELSSKDGTEALTEDGEFSFFVSVPFPPTMINGLEGSWIRARLMAGNYGEKERLEFTELGQGVRRIPSTLAPPCIQSVTAAYASAAGPVPPESIVTNNNLTFETNVCTAPFRPFRRAMQPYQALYLGFKAGANDKQALADRAVDLYFHMGGSVDRAFIREGRMQHLPRLSWQYWSGKSWTDVQVEDATESLTVPGLVRIRVGSDIALWSACSIENGWELYWLRVLLASGAYECPPKLCRVLLNTVPASQATTIEKELMGSSNGQPNQIFRSARVPVLHDLQLEVREPDMPPDEELTRLYAYEGDGAVAIDRNPQGKIEQIWVRWHEVSDLFASDHNDRHFVVDRQSGLITFGDGVTGLIPPAGANNIRLRRYQTGGGSLGNKPPGSITQLRSSVLYVDSVCNHEPALGGQDIEDWDSVRQRGACLLRHRDRAVTMEDYEDLAKLASPLVAKAKCYANLDLASDPAGRESRAGVVSLIIVPYGEIHEPQPDRFLLRSVRDFLNARRMPDSQLVILAPEYVRVSIDAVVVATDPDASATIIGLCRHLLAGYLHPLTGGMQGEGWEFGKRPHESDLYALLESVRELEYVQSLSIRMEEQRRGLIQSGIFLICSGQHTIRLRS